MLLTFAAIAFHCISIDVLLVNHRQVGDEGTIRDKFPIYLDAIRLLIIICSGDLWLYIHCNNYDWLVFIELIRIIPIHDMWANNKLSATIIENRKQPTIGKQNKGLFPLT